jgi:hypothetical protein
MAQTNPKLLVEIAKLRVQRAQRHLDRQREAVAALEGAGQDATTLKRLLKISERALATHAADRDRLTNGAVADREARREVIRHRQDYGTPESKSDSLERFLSGVGSHPPTSRGLDGFHGQENGLDGDVGWRVPAG